MTDAQTFSWILLAVHEKGSTRRQISEMADAINHAVPTQQEIQTSLRWLQERGLVCMDGSFSCTHGFWDSACSQFEEADYHGDMACGIRCRSEDVIDMTP